MNSYGGEIAPEKAPHEFARRLVQRTPVRAGIGAGTSGTFVGVSRAVKKINPDVLCVLVEPEGSIYGGGPAGPKQVEGIGQTQFLPDIYDADLPDEIAGIQPEGDAETEDRYEDCRVDPGSCTPSPSQIRT